MQPDAALTLRLAARAMARHGLVHAYGHVSMRLDNKRFLVSPPQPLGTVGSDDAGVEVMLDVPLPPRALPEVRIHREIYRRRPDVGGICRVQPSYAMALSALGRTPRALHGLGSYAPEPPLWPHVALVRDDAAAAAVADMLGPARAIVLRGNGCVTVGTTLEAAAAQAFFLEDAARLEIMLLPALAAAQVYTENEVAARAVTAGGLYERMWDYLCFEDVEWRHKH